MVWAGAAITEVPSVERDRIYGDSNLHAIRDGLRVLRTIVVERLRLRAGRVLGGRVRGSRILVGRAGLGQDAPTT